MREEIGIFEDESCGYLRARFPQLKEEGKRSPTYNLCTLKHFKIDPKTGKKRKKPQRDKIMAELYSAKLASKEAKLLVKEVILCEADKHSVAETIDKYLNEILSSRSRSSQELFGQQLKFWRSKFGSYRLSELNPLEIKTARDGLKTETRSNSTLNRYLASFSAVLGCAVKDFLWMDVNPCNKIRKLSEPKSRIRFLSLEEKETLLSHCGTDLHDAVTLALLTGARKQEIWRLRYDAVNFKRKFVSFLITKSGIPRSVPMSGAVHEIIVRRARENGFRSPFVFPSPIREDRPHDFGGSWRTAVRNARIEDFRWHDLRHTSASYMVMAGISLRTVADILGHANISMTFKYAHLSPLHLSSALDLLSDELSLGKAKVKGQGLPL